MKHIYTITLFLFLAASVQAQRTAVVSKVTATWCSRCGSWGWDFMEAIKDDYADEDAEALPLGVHYSGKLVNPVSQWFASNLDASGQPQFFVNNEFISVGSSTWRTQVDALKTMISGLGTNPSNSVLEFVNTRIIDNDGNHNVSIRINPISDVQNEHYLAVYVFENNVIEEQASVGPMANHPNVLRDVISDNNFGDLYMAPGDAARAEEVLNFVYTPDPSYKIENLGVLAIMWEKIGNDYVIDYSIATKNWMALTSTDELTESNVTLQQGANEIMLSADDNQEYEVLITNQSGQTLSSARFQNNTSLSTSEFISGLYYVTVGNKEKRETFKVFVR